ncbi:MAG: hypothetical protein R3F61_20370 [Myxococcota bacterium]
MRQLFVLATLAMATPALAGDCPTGQDRISTEISAARAAYLEIAGMFDRVSNGLDQLAGRSRPQSSSKTPYKTDADRADLGDVKCGFTSAVPVSTEPKSITFK